MGYTQIYRIIYGETFALLAELNTVRVFMSLAANFDWPLHQFGVKNAFMHKELTKEVYMELPPGSNRSPKHWDKLCRLKKSLYGLK